MKKITAYKTADGAIFETPLAAETHLRSLYEKLLQQLCMSLFLDSNEGAKQVVKQNIDAFADLKEVSDDLKSIDLIKASRVLISTSPEKDK